MFDFTLEAHSPDDIAHIIQVSLAPAFILAGLAQMLNVFSARLARIADKVNATAMDLNQAGAAEAHYLSHQLEHTFGGDPSCSMQPWCSSVPALD